MSDVFKEYKIPFAGLRRETHEFDFVLDESFFANFENTLIRKCQVQVHVALDKTQEPAVLEIDLDGTVWSDCDKCTASIPIAIHQSFTLFVKNTPADTDSDADDVEEIIYLAKDDNEINLSQHLYEFVHLSIPVHVICDNPGKTDYCDQDILQRLEGDTNNEESSDPRWAALNKLKDKLN